MVHIIWSVLLTMALLLTVYSLLEIFWGIYVRGQNVVGMSFLPVECSVFKYSHGISVNPVQFPLKSLSS